MSATSFASHDHDVFMRYDFENIRPPIRKRDKDAFKRALNALAPYGPAKVLRIWN
ncbi:MAG: hypothetical protein L0387_04440 [Acidobacteria bacterium]|nr:hypothetical protein [Acidobacteriota bacterium]MCI0620911.1 hypothetical protein [Acidobacteriota bacterium]MCI0720375.1 hypothetical protein [Acidobacteriota bacterium]